MPVQTITHTFTLGTISAEFTSAPDPQKVGIDVTFTDTSTGSPTSWAWDFGDGGSSTDQNPTHSYIAPGPYTVQLIATNAFATNTISHVVNILQPLLGEGGCAAVSGAGAPSGLLLFEPGGGFTMLEGIVPVGQPIRFEAEPPGPFHWVFNGEEDESTNQNVVRSFKSGGNKLVRLEHGPGDVHFQIAQIMDTTHFNRAYSALDVAFDYTDKWGLRLAGPVQLSYYINVFVADASDPTTQRIRSFANWDASFHYEFTFPTAEYLDVSQGRMHQAGNNLWIVGNTSDLFFLDSNYTEIGVYGFPGLFLKAVINSVEDDHVWVLATESKDSNSEAILIKVNPGGGVVSQIRTGRIISPEVAHLSHYTLENPALAFFNGSGLFRPGAGETTMTVVDSGGEHTADFTTLPGSVLLFPAANSRAWTFSSFSVDAPAKHDGSSYSYWPLVEEEQSWILVEQIEVIDEQNVLAWCRDYSINSDYTGITDPVQQKNSGMGFLGLWNVILRQWVWQVWDYEWIQDPAE